VELHRQLGGRTKDDVPYQYLTFFMEDDDELEEVRRKYESGEMLTGEIKALCIQHVQEYVAAFQERRKKVTPETREEFMAIRPLTFGGNPNVVKLEEKKPTNASAEANGHAASHKKKKSVSATEKRTQLMREAEELRAKLSAKEREIDELG